MMMMILNVMKDSQVIHDEEVDSRSNDDTNDDIDR